MVERELLEAIGGWSGYSLERAQWLEAQSRMLSLYLKPKPGPMRCEHCGRGCSQVHETTVRRVHDLSLFEYRVVLHVPRRRLWCEHCGGPRLEKLEWPGRYQRVTDRLARASHQLLQSSNVQAVGSFFEQLPPGVAQCIRAVAIDMTTAYELEIKAHCPQAEIVHDLFHVVAKCGREVIDRVRVDQANRLRSQPQARRVLKSRRWSLLRKRTSLQPQQTVHLDEPEKSP